MQKELIPYTFLVGISGAQSALPLHLLFTGFMAVAVHCSNSSFTSVKHSQCGTMDDAHRKKPGSRENPLSCHLQLRSRQSC